MAKTSESVTTIRKARRSKALIERSELYPVEWEGRVPLRIRALQDVRADIPGCASCVYRDVHYYCTVNRHGAVAALDGDWEFGLKPGEFEVAEWHGTNELLVPPPHEELAVMTYEDTPLEKLDAAYASLPKRYVMRRYYLGSECNLTKIWDSWSPGMWLTDNDRETMRFLLGINLGMAWGPL
jgi:hypothetical protein